MAPILRKRLPQDRPEVAVVRPSKRRRLTAHSAPLPQNKPRVIHNTGEGNALTLPLQGRFSDVPLEILWGIFFEMQPMDLLNLARTNKFFRKILMTHDAFRFWENSLQNFQPSLPPCPLFMREPHYVDLMFGTSCQGCGRDDRNPEALWEFGYRYCTRCKLKYTITRTIGDGNNNFSPMTVALCPRLKNSRVRSSSRRTGYTLHRDYVNGLLERLSKTRNMLDEMTVFLTYRERLADMMRYSALWRDWVVQKREADIIERHRQLVKEKSPHPSQHDLEE